MTRETKMKLTQRLSILSTILMLTACSTAATTSSISHGSDSEQVFSTPEDAASALVEANRHSDKAAMLKILGPNGAKLISSGDPVADRESRQKFVDAYDASHELEAENENKEVLVIGEEEWPLPIPLVRVENGGWRFDTKAGEQEILDRRIGHNELTVIEICRSYVDAQREYASATHHNGKSPVYAEKFISSEGKHDGLYWPARNGEQESPLGPLLANARAEGYPAGEHHRHEPYHGYYFKILKQQGPDAAGGARNYIVHGRMTGGFAMIAFPAAYGNSGIMTFIVNQNGIVFEKNLGPHSADIAGKITSYNPDKSWHVADQEDAQ